MNVYADLNEGEVKADLHEYNERCDRCQTWEDEEIIEGVELPSWMALTGALFLALIIIGIWEALKALLTWIL